MASSPGAGPRHVGSVVDPSVREDGELEPDLRLRSEAPPNDSPDPGDAAHASPSAEEHHPIRDRLLARAHAARDMGPEPSAPVHGSLDEIAQTREHAAPRGELDVLGLPGHRAPSAPLGARQRAQLSPTLLSVFGALIGVATVVSLTALMISIDRRHAPASQVSSAPEPVVSAAPVIEVPPSVNKPPRQKVPGPWRITDAKGDPKLHVLEGKIGTDSFIKAVSNAKLEEKEAYRVLAAMKDVRDLNKCNKQDHFSALVERATSRLRAFEYVTSTEEVYQAREGADGFLKAAKLDLKLERGQVTGSLVYDGKNFDASAQKAGFDPGLGHVVALALQGHLQMSELERGDVVRVIVQEVSMLGEFARYSGVEAIEVRHSDGKSEPLRVYYFDVPSLRGYYDATGKSPTEGGWRKPIKDAPVTSPFNPKRMHPILHKIMPHLGTDIGAPIGTPVGASAPGTVSFVGPGGPAGNLLKIMHPDGVETGYAHLSRYAEGIKVGDKVKRMQVIGYVGSTGRSTGPHLHFSASRDGKFFDAETLNLDGMRVLGKEDRDQFALVAAKYNPLLDAIPLPTPPADMRPEPIPVASAAPATGAPPASDDPSLNDGSETADESATVAPAASGNPPAAAPAPGGKPHSSIYLTDKELM
ncbi:MAG TPA: peptidoglycan DD-metalloendopeptidase family protein, partial [Polyangiaceae bacterium]